MLYKNEERICEVLDNGFSGEGICRIDNQVIFVPNAIKGEKVKIKIIKINKNFAFARLEQIIEKSIYRDEPICPVFYRCGGCDLQHIEYSEQMNIKKAQIEGCLKKENIDTKVEKVIGMGIPYYYRNKVGYPVRVNSQGKNIMGFYAKRSHDIIENDICYIQDKECDEIAKYAFDVVNNLGLSGYNEEKNIGDIKHILVRKGYHTDEVMVTIVTTKRKVEKLLELAKIVAEKYKTIKSVVQNVNNSKENEILGEENIVIYGDEYITDVIGECKYKISASSFYQVNPIQTEILYNLVKEKLEKDKSETILDLYSGVGTIGIFIANQAKKVYGVEIVKEAVEMSKQNAKLNDISNIEYICGQVDEKITEIIEKESKIDVIIVDPPRKGLDEKTIEIFKTIKSKKIIYVSCNPATLARDIKLLQEIYDVNSIKPIDLFPQTSHVECVVVLGLKENLES